MQENAYALMKTMAANLATMVTSLAGLGDLTGTWGYTAGTGAGTYTLSGGKRVVGLTVFANGGSVTMTINGGDTVTIPSGSGISFTPNGQLLNPTIILTGPADYAIEYLT